MPIYEVYCEICDKNEDIFLRIKDIDDLPICCGKKMIRKIGAPRIIPEIQPYRSQIDGSMITSRKQHRNHLKDNGCIEVGNEKQQSKKREEPKGLRDAIGQAVYQHLG